MPTDTATKRRPRATGRSRLDAIHVLVRPPDDIAAAAVTRVVKAALATTRWGRTRAVRSESVEAHATSPARNDVLVTVTATERTADALAAHAHELVQLLYDTGRFLRVEADLPVPAFDPSGVSIAATTSVAQPRLGAAGGGDTCTGNAAASAHDWALRAINVPAALALMAPDRVGGQGIVIGHPDSGYSNHPILGGAVLDLARDRDVISDDDDARDPLRPPKKSLFKPLPSPGHGTATGSVIAGTGETGVAAPFRGVAPRATMIPIRAIESVVQLFDNDVAKAVRWARAKGCHVVSMSLGGKGLFGLEDAIQEAVDDGMIVMAAAGNQVGFVTAPASYGNCLAVAAVGADRRPWSGSSHGGQVDVSAPGACVWAALFDWSASPPRFVVRQSNGTSYAVAHLAGVAALWLAHHGHAALVTRYGRRNVQAVFLHQLRRPGVCRRPTGWDADEFGAGIVDAAALLQAPLPAPHEVRGRRGAAPAVVADPVERLAGQLAMSVADTRTAVERLLGAAAARDVGTLRRFEGELAYHLADPAKRAVLLGVRRGRRGRRGAADAAPGGAVAGVSPQLQRLLDRRA